jgi:hypothetical protein
MAEHKNAMNVMTDMLTDKESIFEVLSLVLSILKSALLTIRFQRLLVLWPQNVLGAEGREAKMISDEMVDHCGNCGVKFGVRMPVCIAWLCFTCI